MITFCGVIPFYFLSRFSGICAGIKLQTELDIHDFIIFDENHDVGGTWLTHVYPGCACDGINCFILGKNISKFLLYFTLRFTVASHVYSYSFELNPSKRTINAKM